MTALAVAQWLQEAPKAPVNGWSTASWALKCAWLDRIATKCPTRHCSSFKSRPSSDCPVCGDSPLPTGMCPYEYDRGRGFERW